MPSKPKYRRILLKLSGEGLMGEREYGIDPKTVDRICGEIKTVYDNRGRWTPAARCFF